MKNFYGCLVLGTVFSCLILTPPLSSDDTNPVSEPVWKEDFNTISKSWKVKTKPGTNAAEFTVEKSQDGQSSWLVMTADKASSTLGTEISTIDLNKTPIIKFKWRATILPEGADGRNPDKDDQAIGIYIGEGGMLSQKSIAYRWETDTPAGSEGNAKYAGGVVKVKWFALRTKTEADGVTFYEEERNVAEDFKKAYGYIPEKFTIGISCNSNYTKTKAAAQLDWILIQ